MSVDASTNLPYTTLLDATLRSNPNPRRPNAGSADNGGADTGSANNNGPDIGGIDPGGLLDPDAAAAYLTQWKGRIDRMAADTAAVSDRLDRLRVTGTDGNGLAEVTIDATGTLLDVRFTDRIRRVAPDTVARAVMSALRAARRKAAENSRRIVAETLGDQSVAARTIADRVEQRLLRPVPEMDRK